MSKIYDNWERLVAAVLRKQQLWELFHDQSRSPSISSASSDFSFSFQLNSSLDDVPFTFSSSEKEESVLEVVTDFRAAFDLDDIGSKTAPGNPSRSISVKDQSPVVPVNLSSNGNASSSSRRKRNLNILVPKLHSENYMNLSPRMTSPGPSSRTNSGAVTQLHPRVGGRHAESQSNWPDDAKQSYPLPLPPITISSSSPPFSHPNSAATSPSVPRSPGRVENPISPDSRWKKGKFLGKGKFGSVYAGFNSETGEMCAMKEVSLFADDAELKQSSKQLGLEIALLSRLKHPNIVQYYGSEMVHDKFYIYLEYVSGGSIYTILKQYGTLGESALRSYTRQILSGLAYLHAKHTVHRNIKGANILLDPSGCVKLADFGMAKHGSQIAGLSPLLFTGHPYWMAPEVIRDINVCNQATDIWSLGCTVLEMATAKPPWSQYKGDVATFKIRNGKELPVIPDYLSDEGKDFVKQCLQWNPLQRPTAAHLLEHPFLKRVVPLEKQILGSTSSDHFLVTNAVKSVGVGHASNPHQLESERLAIHSCGGSKSTFHSSDIYIARNFSSPVSPLGMPLQHPRSPQNLSRSTSPSPISSPRATSGSSTPITSGIGAIPYQHLNQSTLLQEGIHNLPKHTPSPSFNSPSYWDPNILRRVQSGSHAFREPSSINNNAIGKQFGNAAANGQIYDGQSVWAGRVSQQLLRIL